jgi:hypothetical protein
MEHKLKNISLRTEIIQKCGICGSSHTLERSCETRTQISTEKLIRKDERQKYFYVLLLQSYVLATVMEGEESNSAPSVRDEYSRRFD